MLFNARVRTVAAGLLALGVTATPAHAEEISEPRLLGATVIPPDLTVDGTMVGSLSGIDYDPETGDYLLVTDDRSENDPSRFFRAEIDVDGSGVHGVDFTAAHILRQPNGDAYPNRDDFVSRPCPDPRADCARTGSVDPESIRLDPVTGDVWWTTEGERVVDGDLVVLQNPQVRLADPGGTTVRALPTPRTLTMSASEVGPRRNLTFEGLTLTPNGRVVTAMEGPLYQDGPVPTAEEGAVVRFTVTNRHGVQLAQYGYPLEPLFAAPEPADGTADQGVSEILADPERPGSYIVVERAFVEGSGNKVRLYRATTARATDISGAAAIPDMHREPRLMAKELLLDLDDLDLAEAGLDHVDNIEGVTWGPELPSGERTLLLISDDNFSDNQETQLIALAVD
ncbi:esterase-like activity of phytase family protein [Marinactinospora rubrisoli]|uniref:Esterase-like activity of phytase family protein n=1 Tax=Marinactinospora rubrisoli TaxID=2715399 RepID=A0ABW2KDV7_9ACTN